MYAIQFTFHPHQKALADKMLDAINSHQPIESGTEEQRELVNYKYGGVWRYIVWSKWEDDSMTDKLNREFSMMLTKDKAIYLGHWNDGVV